MLKCKVSKLAKTIWPLVRADIPVFVHGWTGIGKTEVISTELMRLVNNHFGPSVLHDIRMSSKEPVDGTGIPKIVQDEDGNWVTIWTRPAFVDRDDGRMHVYYLGEISHASIPMQHITYQFVRERRLGNFPLPKKNRVILDLNTRDDKGGDTKLLKPLENRGAHILAEAEVSGWVEHEKAMGLDPRLIAFVKLRGELLHKLDPNNPAYPTPRSIEEVGKLMRQGEPDNVVVDGAVALCGEGFAMQLQTFLKDLGAQLPKLADIKANPKGAKVPTEPHHQYVVAAAISHEIDMASADTWATYLARLMPDIASMAANNAMQGNEQLKNSKSLKSLIL